NPFNPETTIKFQIPEQSFITLEVFDISGRKVNTLVNNVLTPGSYEFNFDGSNLSSGIYFYRFTSNKFSQTKKM
ncbi:MAG TPA: T9SS C-terminal target domain-containing protein, partial [Bacteroidetes bacterium]|nr:T9SS C-terminal target domain-containing protein [Bacteroidota bacterium]